MKTRRCQCGNLKMEDEFKIVTGKRRNKKCPNIGKSDLKNASGNFFSEQADVSQERSIQLIKLYRNEIKSSCFWDELKTTFNGVTSSNDLKVEEIISYGSGHISSNPIARYQFALLLLFAQTLKLTSHVFIYDPVFTVTERNIVSHFGFKLIEENEECKRKIARPSFVFMMHCGKAMYNNLLKANWGMGLEKILLVGNLFSSYMERLPSKILRSEAPYLCDIIPYTKELLIKNSFQHNDIFNDTAFITFPRTSLSSLGDAFWEVERPETNIENDSEIISKSKIQAYSS